MISLIGLPVKSSLDDWLYKLEEIKMSFQVVAGDRELRLNISGWTAALTPD